MIMLLILSETEQFTFLSDDYWAQAKSGNDSLQNVREYGQKLFVTLKGLWVWMKPLKKENLWQKSFFSDNVK